MAEKLVTFCHISDLHIAEYPTVSYIDLKHKFTTRERPSIGFFTTADPKKLEALARFFALKANEFDFVLITGDIASTARNDDLLKSLDYIDSKNSSSSTAWYKGHHNTRANLSLLHPNIILFPGNHDRITTFTQVPKLYYDVSRNFEQIFSNYWKPISESRDSIAIEQVILNNGKELFIVKIDFSLKKDRLLINEIGNGKVEDDILGLLQEVFRKLKDKCFIVATHFSPGFENISKCLSLKNEEKFIELLEKYKIKHIFTGHSHISRVYNIKENFSIKNYCCSSATSYGSENNIHVYYMDTENQISMQSYMWDKKMNTYL